jgi:GTP pyrophosphokinase
VKAQPFSQPIASVNNNSATESEAIPQHDSTGNALTEPNPTFDRRITVSALLLGKPWEAAEHHPAQPRSRAARRHLNRQIAEGSAAVEPLLEVFRRQHPDAREELDWLKKSYQVAEFLHRGQMRKSGAPYIAHPLAVATILADLGMDATTLVAALMHDTVEDTDYTLGECRADFGRDVAFLVDGVTKMDAVQLGKEAAERETFRKMVLAAGADLRVLMIKLVDRLHNLRTLGAQPAHKQARIARQSMELLVPFCDRLGLYRLKRELEDLAFRYLHPQDYEVTITEVKEGVAKRQHYFAPVLSDLHATLKEHDVQAEVTARPRHLFSLYSARKTKPTKLTPGRVSRVVIVVNGDERDCWIALGAVHQRFSPIVGRLRDHIATPKYNLYQSLHTSVFGPEGEQLDVLIRTTAMQEVAEDGIAATIRDTSRMVGHAAAGEHAQRRGDLDWLQRLLSWQGQMPSDEYLDELRTELRGGSIVVVTPDGDLFTLPNGSTGIDYAFAQGEHIGGRLIGVRVNGRLTRVTAALHNGDLVEVITAEHTVPAPEWLASVKTSQARRGLQAIIDSHNSVTAQPHLDA